MTAYTRKSSPYLGLQPGGREADVLLEHAPRVPLVPGLRVRLLRRLAVEREARLHVGHRLGACLEQGQKQEVVRSSLAREANQQLCCHAVVDHHRRGILGQGDAGMGRGGGDTGKCNFTSKNELWGLLVAVCFPKAFSI